MAKHCEVRGCVSIERVINFNIPLTEKVICKDKILLIKIVYEFGVSLPYKLSELNHLLSSSAAI